MVIIKYMRCKGVPQKFVRVCLLQSQKVNETYTSQTIAPLKPVILLLQHAITTAYIIYSPGRRVGCTGPGRGTEAECWCWKSIKVVRLLRKTNTLKYIGLQY